MKTAAVAFLLTAMAVSAGCGFTCKVKGEDEAFSGCDDLQTRIDDERDEPQQDGEAIDDLQVCGDVNGCNIR